MQGVNRYHHTDQSDALIRKAYATRDRKERQALAAKAMALIGAKRRISVYTRALNIGAIPANQEPGRFWTRPEVEILEANAHLNPKAIQAKLAKAGHPRTLVAIVIRVKRFHGGITQNRIDAGLFNATGAAYLLGVNSKNICDWIRRGWLKARRSGLSEREDDQWEIRAKDLRAFVIDNAGRIDGAKCDLVWLVDLLTNNIAD
jgi:hypothetical protein